MAQVNGTCDTCAYLIYDDDFDEYVCDINMDEDDYARMVSDHHASCPFYRLGDEYAVVRKQN